MVEEEEDVVLVKVRVGDIVSVVVVWVGTCVDCDCADGYRIGKGYVLIASAF